MTRRPPRSTLFLHDALPICDLGNHQAAAQPSAPDAGGAPRTFSQLAGQCRIRSLQRSEEHTSELQSHSDLVCRLLLEKKKTSKDARTTTTSTRPPQSTKCNG